MERADKLGAAFAVMLGEDEIRASTITLKDLKSGAQETMARSELIKKIGNF